MRTHGNRGKEKLATVYYSNYKYYFHLYKHASRVDIKAVGEDLLSPRRKCLQSMLELCKARRHLEGKTSDVDLRLLTQLRLLTHTLDCTSVQSKVCVFGPEFSQNALVTVDRTHVQMATKMGNLTSCCDKVT
ncbi:jg24132 [Pararge aegeria aegeria]|uniref:Jg24132 protein n=1 Tax=Pararge aegeria aegeria TaxID=348720 RepID=A0A8S4RNG7_9NEOP|nr:jg24132 [Pararge aegeria aegeria]